MRIVSGSFGSFDGRVVSRFDERPYRLVQVNEGKDQEMGDPVPAPKPDMFKRMPWLR